MIFHLAKEKKNGRGDGDDRSHITWNCHSFFVHSSFLLMFGFCHKLSLITRYSGFRAFLRRDAATCSLLGLTRQPTSIIYDIHPEAFVSYLTNKHAEYNFTHSLFSYYTLYIYIYTYIYTYGAAQMHKKYILCKPWEWKLQKAWCKSSFIWENQRIFPKCWMCCSEVVHCNAKLCY